MAPAPIDKVKIVHDQIDAQGTQDTQARLKISSLEDVASYNWLSEQLPTILVPGIPPVWSPPGISPRLKADTGIGYVDQNADRNPWCPLEPLVRAVSTVHPNFDFNAIDIMTDRWPIRKLFALVSGSAGDFEFGVEILGSTAIFVRMEKQTRQEIPHGKFQGFRRTFEEEYTRIPASVRGSTSHHRIIKYKLGGLKLLVRSAVDAYVEVIVKPKASSRSSDNDPNGELLRYMKAASLEHNAPSTIETPDAPGVTVIQGEERGIPRSALLELRTRSKFSRNASDLEEKMPDLWISQTPNFINALYQSVRDKSSRSRLGKPGLAEFTDVEVMPMKDELSRWETENAPTIHKLVEVLKQVLNAARAINAPCIATYRSESATLVVSRAEAGLVPAMPEDIRQKWSPISPCA